MNVNLDLSAVKAFAQKVLGELREKRLWPAAVVLLVAIVAVPVVLSKSSSPAPVPAGQQPTPPPSQATSLPAISEQSKPSQSRIRGAARNPFAQQAGATTSSTGTPTTTTATSTATATSLGTTGASGSQTGAAGSSSATGGATPTGTATTPASITHNAHPKPAPAGLSPTQSYDVTLAITNASGGLDTLDLPERLTVLPSDQAPMLVELGVLQGGQRVLFAVLAGTVVNGPGVCAPGPIDCEVVSLAQDQTESMSRQTSAGTIQGPLFAVTGIAATDHGSVKAANAARGEESPAGRGLIDTSPLTAWSLFQYRPSLGTVVDLRNLMVGGN